jgi:hypothetical protein
MADQQGISQRAVLPSQSMMQLVCVLPTTQNALGKINGIARRRLEHYGRDNSLPVNNLRLLPAECEASYRSPFGLSL